MSHHPKVETVPEEPEKDGSENNSLNERDSEDEEEPVGNYSLS